MNGPLSSLRATSGLRPWDAFGPWPIVRERADLPPERGLRIAQAREAKRRVKNRVTKLPELVPPNPDSPLVRRLQNMAQRQGKR